MIIAILGYVGGLNAKSNLLSYRFGKSFQQIPSNTFLEKNANCD